MVYFPLSRVIYKTLIEFLRAHGESCTFVEIKLSMEITYQFLGLVEAQANHQNCLGSGPPSSQVLLV